MSRRLTPETDRALRTGLGAVSGSLSVTTVTPPLSDSGVLNLAGLGTSAVKVLSGASGSLAAFRCKIACVTASRNLAYSVLAAGAATPSIKADGDGSADEGSLILPAAGGVEFLTVAGDRDLWLVSASSPTVCQVTVFKV